MSDSNRLEALRASLESLKPGPVAEGSGIERLLEDCWDQFTGNDEEGMSAYKLGGRMERIRWDPPVLSFVIERHGGTVMGSSRAELHEWQIDVVERSASCAVVGHRQLKPMAPRLDVTPFARDVAAVIRSGQPDPRLKWLSDDEVRVLVGKIIPADSAVSQTLTGRRKRFWTALDEELTPQGWGREGRDRYRKKGSG